MPYKSCSSICALLANHSYIHVGMCVLLWHWVSCQLTNKVKYFISEPALHIHVERVRYDHSGVFVLGTAIVSLYLNFVWITTSCLCHKKDYWGDSRKVLTEVNLKSSSLLNKLCEQTQADRRTLKVPVFPLTRGDGVNMESCPIGWNYVSM